MSLLPATATFYKPTNTNHKVTVCSSDRVTFFVLCLNWFQNQPAVSSTWRFTSSSHAAHCCGYLSPAVGARAQVSKAGLCGLCPVQLSCACPQGQHQACWSWSQLPVQPGSTGKILGDELDLLFSLTEEAKEFPHEVHPLLFSIK